MTRKLEIGDIVLCQYYNTPDKRFYGETFKAKIKEIQTKGMDKTSTLNPIRDFVVVWMEGDSELTDIQGGIKIPRFSTVWRKEIKRRIK